MTSWPLVNRTLATFLSAEFGFLGVRVITCTQTPRRCGQTANAGDFDFPDTLRRPLRISWVIVGMSQKLEKHAPRRWVTPRENTKDPRRAAPQIPHAPDAASRGI